jgi:hypothetical protein
MPQDKEKDKVQPEVVDAKKAPKEKPKNERPHERKQRLMKEVKVDPNQKRKAAFRPVTNFPHSETVPCDHEITDYTYEEQGRFFRGGVEYKVVQLTGRK